MDTTNNNSNSKELESSPAEISGSGNSPFNSNSGNTSSGQSSQGGQSPFNTNSNVNSVSSTPVTPATNATPVKPVTPVAPSSSNINTNSNPHSSSNLNSDTNQKPLPSYVGMSSSQAPQSSQPHSSMQSPSSQPPKAPIVINEDSLARKTAEYNKSRMVSSTNVNHTYLWSIISFVILLIIVGATYWYFFMNGGTSSQDESTNTNTSDNSAFPAGAINKTPTNPAVSTPAKTNTVTPALNGSQRDLISAYIRKNINSLSPRKSSKAFTVTDITFDGPDRALVSYTNGTVSYTAVATASVSANGNVKISSFTLLDK